MTSALKEVAAAIMAKAPRPGTVKTCLCPPLVAAEAARQAVLWSPSPARVAD